MGCSWCCTWPTRRRKRSSRPAASAAGRCCRYAPSDCQGEAERLRARGVVFVKEPGRMPYGGLDAVLDDTCGNLVNLHQD
jgi:predicted enzyme related to lactoylglutathione lyase